MGSNTINNNIHPHHQNYERIIFVSVYSHRTHEQQQPCYTIV